MRVLVVGASGKTGRLLVGQLLQRGHEVVAMVRAAEHFREQFRERLGDGARERTSAELIVVEGSPLEISDDELFGHLTGCHAIASCLGHNLTLKGVFGPPRRLVTEATKRLCRLAEARADGEVMRFVLMNTAGNINRDRNEHVSFAERCVLGLLRALVPPHADNEQAAEFLRVTIGQDHPRIQWVAVRPDALVDEDQVGDYDLVPSPTRSAIFNSGQTSRLQVAHVMAELLSDQSLWQRWCGQMPVIYNRQDTVQNR